MRSSWGGVWTAPGGASATAPNTRLGGFKSRGLGLVRLLDLQVTGIRGPGLERFTEEWETYRDGRLAAFRSWLDGNDEEGGR